VLIPRPALAAAAAELRAAPPGLRVAAVEVDPALDPLDLVRAGAPVFGTAAYFSGPEGAALGGLGAAWEAQAAGPGRFEDLDASLAGLPGGAVAFLGFSFDPSGPVSPEWAGFPAAAARLAQITLWRKGSEARLILAVPPGAGPSPLLAAAATLRPPAEPAVPAAVGARAVPPVVEWQQTVRAAAAPRPPPARPKWCWPARCG
jgi:hypothetical protein